MGSGAAYTEDKSSSSVRHPVPSNAPSSTDGRTRKRAKTEDEKEQRRIERVLRNRQAAQSSRERKRQEVEKLEGEKSVIEQQNAHLKERLLAVEHDKFLLSQQIAKMAAEMEVFKRASSTSTSGTPSPPPLAEIQFDQSIKQELEDYSLNMSTAQHSLCPPSTTSFSSPSTATHSESSTPATVDLGLDALTSSLDMTQHPAAMLCDLQCQSKEACQASTRPTTRHEAAIRLYTTTPFCQMTLISAVYSQLMHPLRMIFISLRTASPLPPSMMTMPMALPLIRWLISTPANLTPPSTTTTTTTTMATATSTITSQSKTLPAQATSTREMTATRAPVLRLRLLRRLLLSSPSLARPLRAATGRALRLKTRNALNGNAASSRGFRRVACSNRGLSSTRGARPVRRGDDHGVVGGGSVRLACSRRKLQKGKRR